MVKMDLVVLKNQREGWRQCWREMRRGCLFGMIEMETKDGFVGSQLYVGER